MLVGKLLGTHRLWPNAATVTLLASHTALDEAAPFRSEHRAQVVTDGPHGEDGTTMVNKRKPPHHRWWAACP